MVEQKYGGRRQIRRKAQMEEKEREEARMREEAQMKMREEARTSDRGKEMRSVVVEAVEAALSSLGYSGAVGIDYATDKTHTSAIKLAVALIERDAARMSLEAAMLRGKGGRSILSGTP